MKNKIAFLCTLLNTNTHTHTHTLTLAYNKYYTQEPVHRYVGSLVIPVKQIHTYRALAIDINNLLRSVIWRNLSAYLGTAAYVQVRLIACVLSCSRKSCLKYCTYCYIYCGSRKLLQKLVPVIYDSCTCPPRTHAQTPNPRTQEYKGRTLYLTPFKEFVLQF